MTPMQLGTDAEREVLAAAVVTGLALGVLYSLFAVIRRTLKSRAVTFSADLLYTIIYGVVFCVMSLALTDYYRFFVLAGMLLGTAGWCLTAGRLLVWLLCGIVGAAVDHLILPLIDKAYKLVTAVGVKFVESHTNFKNRKKISEIT